MASAARLVCCRLPIDRRTLSRYGRTLGLPDPSTALEALARSIAASPVWTAAPGAVVMVRRRPQPMLAVMGRFDAGQEGWLAVQAKVLDKTCGRLRRVPYRRAEEDCERLAAKLRDRLGRAGLRRARFTAIPRGGFVVLGWLAVALGIEGGQLEPPHPPELPLVAVDDCAVSGSRCRDFLDRHQAHGIIFAHLYSHPELRAAIEAREPRVQACLSARDLEAETSPAELEGQARVLAELERAYWVGATDALAFPWSEPDRLIWHPVEERPVLAWRIVPPELCLKNRASGTRPIPVQEQPEARGPLRPEDEVMFGELEGRIVLHHLERGKSVALDATGSEIWKAIIRRGSLSAAASEIDREYRVAAATLRGDLADFAGQLIDEGFLKLAD